MWAPIYVISVLGFGRYFHLQQTEVTEITIIFRLNPIVCNSKRNSHSYPTTHAPGCHVWDRRQSSYMQEKASEGRLPSYGNPNKLWWAKPSWAAHLDLVKDSWSTPGLEIFLETQVSWHLMFRTVILAVYLHSVYGHISCLSFQESTWPPSLNSDAFQSTLCTRHKSMDGWRQGSFPLKSIVWKM